MDSFVTLTELAAEVGETTAMVRGVAVGAKIALRPVARVLVVGPEEAGRIAALIHEHRAKYPQVKRSDAATTSDAIDANSPAD